MELNRDQIIKALECWTKNFDGKVTDFVTLGQALALIEELTEENKTLTVQFQAMKGAANSYKMHCDKLSEEIFNAFERGQNQAKAETVRKMLEKIYEYYDRPCYKPTKQYPVRHTDVSFMLSVIDKIAKEILEE